MPLKIRQQLACTRDAATTSASSLTASAAVVIVKACSIEASPHAMVASHKHIDVICILTVAATINTTAATATVATVVGGMQAHTHQIE